MFELKRNLLLDIKLRVWQQTSQSQPRPLLGVERRPFVPERVSQQLRPTDLRTAGIWADAVVAWP